MNKREQLKELLFKFWLDILGNTDSDKRDEIIEGICDDIEEYNKTYNQNDQPQEEIEGGCWKQMKDSTKIEYLKDTLDELIVKLNQ